MRPHHDGKAGRRSFAMRRLGAGQEDQAAAPSVVPSGLPFPDTWRYLSTTTTLWIPLECASHSPESHHYSPLSLDNRDFAPEHSWTINARAAHLHREVAREFYRAVPLPSARWTQRFFWRIVLALAATSAGRWLLGVWRGA